MRFDDKFKQILFGLLMFFTLYAIMIVVVYKHVKEMQMPGKVGHKASKEVFVDLPVKVEAIARKLVRTAGVTALNIEFAELLSPRVNAIAFEGNRIAVTSGYIAHSLAATGTYAFLPGTLAHEIGHIVKGDIDVSNEGMTKAEHRNMERRADYYGIELMHRAGYDCKYDSMDWRIQAEKAQVKAFYTEGSHPAMSERMIQSKRICDSLKKTGKMPTDLYFE